MLYDPSSDLWTPIISTDNIAGTIVGVILLLLGLFLFRRVKRQAKAEPNKLAALLSLLAVLMVCGGAFAAIGCGGFLTLELLERRAVINFDADVENDLRTTIAEIEPRAMHLEAALRDVDAVIRDWTALAPPPDTASNIPTTTLAEGSLDRATTLSISRPSPSSEVSDRQAFSLPVHTRVPRRWRENAYEMAETAFGRFKLRVRYDALAQKVFTGEAIAKPPTINHQTGEEASYIELYWRRTSTIPHAFWTISPEVYKDWKGRYGEARVIEEASELLGIIWNDQVGPYEVRKAASRFKHVVVVTWHSVVLHRASYSISGTGPGQEQLTQTDATVVAQIIDLAERSVVASCRFQEKGDDLPGRLNMRGGLVINFPTGGERKAALRLNKWLAPMVRWK